MRSEPLQVSLHVETGFQDHVILVAEIVDRRDRALGEGVVQRVVDVLDRHAILGRLEAVDGEHDLRAAGFAIRVDILHARNGLDAILHLGKPVDDLLKLRAPYRHLILRPALPPAELQLGARKHGDIHALERRELLAQPRDDPESRRFPFGERLERHKEARLVGGAETGAASDGNRDARDVGVLIDDRVDPFLQRFKRVERNIGRCLCASRSQGRCLLAAQARPEAF